MGVPISNVTRRVVYAASGTGPYSFTFEILAAGDIAVYKDDALLTITTDYTVTINSNGTGFITLTASPTGATQIAIVGNRTIQRTTDFVTGGDFFANTVNAELDQQTIFAQQNAEAIQRALIAPQTDPTTINMTLPRKADRANKYLAFDEDGNPKPGDTAIDVAAVAAIATEIETVSDNIAAVTAVADDLNEPVSEINTVATNINNVNTVGGISSNVTTVAGISSNVTTVAGISSNVTTVAGISSAVSGVAAISTAVSAVNSNATNINTVAGNNSNISTVAGISSAVSTVATNSTSVSTVATNITSVNSAATNMAAIIAAPTEAAAAASSASAAATSAAAAAAALDNFDDRYLGPKSSNPTVDNDGNALLTGALYYRTTSPVGMKVYDGAQWLEASAAQQASLVTYEYVATAGQTSFSGNDANGVALSYIQGGLIVSLNGVILRPGDDYTATNGTTVVLASGAALNDEVVMYAFASFQVANTYTQAQTDALLAGKQNADTELTTLAGMTSSRATFLASANDFGFRNRIINGDMRIDQRNAGASVTITNTAAATYVLDRWAGYGSNASRFSVQQNAGAVTPPTGFRNYIGATSLSAYSVGSSENFTLSQNIEGFNVADLGWGTASAQAVTLSFWVRSSLTGTFGGSVINSAINRSYPFSYTVSAANTWEQKTITIAGDTSGTWVTDNGIGIRLSFGLGVGSTLSTTAGSWASGFFISATGATSVVGTNGATFYITGVQLEAGSVATPFERRDYGRELMMCQRYYERLPAGGYPGVGVRTTDWYGYIQWQTEKRANATVTLNGTINIVGSAGDINSQTPTGIDQVSTKSARIYRTGGSFTSQAGTFYVPNFIEISSEL